MLAAPVFSIGLPTLVLLNMSDQMEDRGGKLDTLALARELGHPVALISAAQGHRPRRHHPSSSARRRDAEHKRRAPCTARPADTLRLPHTGPRRSPPHQLSVARHLPVDPPPRLGAAAPRRRPAHLSRRRLRGLPGCLHHRPAALGRLRQPPHARRRHAALLLPTTGCACCCATACGTACSPSSSSCRRSCCSSSLSECWKTPATWPAPRSSPTASCARSASTAKRSSRCSPPMPAPCPPSWPRAPSRTSASASPPSSSRRS